MVAGWQPGATSTRWDRSASPTRCWSSTSPCRTLAAGLRGAQLTVSSVEQKPYTRRPYPPFMTSTLQQEAGRKLRFSSERTMSIAQRLYENGYITYMRTDSTTLSGSAINAARNQARQLYGEEYLHPSPRQYTQGQERPGGARGDPARRRHVCHPGQLHSALDTDEFRLYELIWQRTVASQMADALAPRCRCGSPDRRLQASRWCSTPAAAPSRSPAS